jgi:hypothetical protein
MSSLENWQAGVVESVAVPVEPEDSAEDPVSVGLDPEKDRDPVEMVQDPAPG